MLDIKKIKENPEKVKEALKKRNSDCLLYTSWEGLTNLDISALPSLFPFDWKQFKLETLIQTAQTAYDIFKTVNPAIPVGLPASSFTSSAASLYSGGFDPTLLPADVIQADANITDPSQNRFIFDYVSSVTGKMTSGELDGGWIGTKDVAKYPEIVETLGRSGVNCLSVSNWTVADIGTYFDTFSQYSTAFRNTESREEGPTDDVIFVNTLDFAMRELPVDLYTIYKSAYNNMTGAELKKVRFITDTQILKDPSILETVKIIHVGNLAKQVFIDETLADLLAEKDLRIIDASGAQPQYVNQYGKSLSDEVQKALNTKISNG